MRASGVVGALACAAASTACGLLVGFPDRHLAADADAGDAQPFDGDTTAADGAGGDARGDAPSDAGDAGDARADAGDGASDAAHTFCARPPSSTAGLPRVFCSDFEGDAGLAPWNAPNGAVTLDPTSAAPPDTTGTSLDVASPDGGTSSISHTFAQSFATIELAFDLFMDAPQPSDNTFVAQIAMPSLVMVLKIGFGGGSPEIQDYFNGQGDTTNHALNVTSADWAEGRWLHLDIVMSLGASPPTVAVTVNRTIAALPPQPIRSEWSPGAPTLVVESAPQATAAPRAYHVDNVELYAQ